MGIDKTTSAEGTGGGLKNSDLIRYSEDLGGGSFSSQKQTVGVFKTYFTNNLDEVLAKGNNANNRSITNVNSLSVTTISEQVAGNGVNVILDNGAFVVGGNTVSVSLADDTETFFMTANGGISFSSSAGMTLNGSSLLLADGSVESKGLQVFSANISTDKVLSYSGGDLSLGDNAADGAYVLVNAAAGIVGVGDPSGNVNNTKVLINDQTQSVVIKANTTQVIFNSSGIRIAGRIGVTKTLAQAITDGDEIQNGIIVPA